MSGEFEKGMLFLIRRNLFHYPFVIFILYYPIDD